MHLILQMYLDGILRKEDLSMFYLKHFAANVRAKPPNFKIYQNYFEQGLRYFEMIDFPHQNIIGVEQNVTFTFAGKPWTGFIDVVSLDEHPAPPPFGGSAQVNYSDGKLIVTDHKSRTLKPRSKRSKKTKADEELDEYLRQLYVYSAAVKEQYGRFPDALEFNCFRSQLVIQEPFEIKRYWQVEDWAKRQIETITTNDDWRANPEFWRCNYLCDVCRHCEIASFRSR